MSKYLGPKLKLYKKIGIDLNLKSGIKTLDKKCKINKNNNFINNYKNKISDYSLQLKEKQKLKRLYCLFEKQFIKYYKKSSKNKKNIVENLFQILETRLDNIVYRIGLARTRLEARQFVNHKLIYVNNKIINIPSYKININDIIKLSNKIINNNIKIKDFFKNYYIKKNKKSFLQWIKIDFNDYSGKLLYIPKINEINDKNINGNLIIELYSK